MKQKHIADYKREYCTLCHGLRIYLGLMSTLLLNYECVFLYVFLDSLYRDAEYEQQKFRCPINPLRKRNSFANLSVLEYASFMNYHLAVLKAEDGIADSRGIKKVLAKAAFYLLKNTKKYRKLVKKYEKAAFETENYCKQLYALEEAQCNDFDRCAAQMGTLLHTIILCYFEVHPIDQAKATLSFAIHLGMWIYLVDAYDDYDADRKSRKFNPLNSFADNSSPNSEHVSNLEYGELMLQMMSQNLTKQLSEIKLYSHSEIINNIIQYGTQEAIQKIIQRRKKENECKHLQCKRPKETSR